MPRPLCFYPFRDKKHVSSHFGAPTFARRDFLYLWQLGNHSTTFKNYIANDDRIYVMGRCFAGSDAVLASESGRLDGTHSCSPGELAEIFYKHGLPINSRAHIRIHACSSATPAAGPNFATEFAKEMAKKSYHVTIRGYDVAVGMYVVGRLTVDKHAIDYHPSQNPM